MKHWTYTATAVLTIVALLLSLAPTVMAASVTETYTDAHVIVLDSIENGDGSYTHSATYDGAAVTEYDYTWHADPSEVHSDVKNAPAEYYTGTEPGDEAVYIAHDIYYYPELDESGFSLVNYDGDQEWAYYYTAEGYTDYIFATLPYSGSSLPTSMMHSEEEAYENAVLHITEAGTYIIQGDWHGQIWIDLGDTDDTFADADAKVTVVLNGVDVTCTVAPALVFYSVYECDNTWEDQTSWSSSVDTSDAGANVILADGTENSFTGENIYRMLKTAYKSSGSSASGSVALQKKRLKQDGAFYSYVSMNIAGESAGTGVLNITAGYEGLDSELHLTINSGNVNIYSQDDGINVNEDDVSVFTVNGGSLHILAGLGSEGDGVDSNGYLVINGGTVISMANPSGDSGLDSDCGSYVNGGTVVALGSTMDWADGSGSSGQVTMNLQFAAAQSADEAIIITETDGTVVFAYDPDKDEIAGSNARSYQGAILSCAGLETGESYFIYVGGDVYGTETAGVYVASTVTGFSADAKQQCYTGTQVGMGESGGPNSGFGGMTRPGGLDSGTFGGSDAASSGSIYFTMTDTVNSFSGVTDYSGGSGSTSTLSFTDVPESAYYYNAVLWAVNTQITNGTSATTFSPDNACTRAMVVTFLWRAAGSPAPQSTTNPFVDVVNTGDTAWYYEAVLWAVEQNITTGVDDTHFAPDDPCTRAMVATFLWRANGAPAPSGTTGGFSDVADSSQYYYDAVLWCTENGIINGMGDGTYAPADTCTRAQVMTMLYRNYCVPLST